MTGRQVAVLERARQGFPAPMIARQTGLNQSLVYDISVALRKQGVESRMPTAAEARRGA